MKTLSAVGHRLSALSVSVLLASMPAIARGQTSLSIYSDGRVVVRRTVPQALQKGRNVSALRLEGLDPATLFSPDTAVTITKVILHPPSSAADAMSRGVGQTLSFVRAKGDTIQATVLRVDPPQFRLSDGRVLLSPPGEPLFPADLVRTSPEATVTLEASRSRPTTALAYVTQGVKWEATYQVVLTADGSRGTVGGGATLTSQTLRADSAAVQLVAGSVQRARSAAQEGLGAPRMAALAVSAEQAAMPVEQAVGETHVYSLPGTVSLEPGVPLTVALFPRVTAGVAQEFVVPGVLPWRGYFGQVPSEPNQVPVQVWYTLTRGHGSAFGDHPLPAGTVELFQPDSTGQVQLIGEAAIGHTPVGKDLRIQSGDAFDVTAERVQTDYSQEQVPSGRRGVPARMRVTASYQVTVTNAKTKAITVDVRETHFGTWRVVDSSAPAEKLSSTESRFRLSVAAGGTAVLTYTVQVDS
jgi:hypothetical protein